MIPKNLLPEGCYTFIAGGWAACPALADDMDVWVSLKQSAYSIRKLGIEKARTAILAHLQQQIFSYWTVEEQDDSRQTEAVVAGYEINVNIRKVAKVTSYEWHQPIHVIVTDASVYQVLEGFDISTHQIAITDNGIVLGEEWTSVTEEPIVLHMSTQTPARLEKIRNRYKGAYAQV